MRQVVWVVCPPLVLLLIVWLRQRRPDSASRDDRGLHLACCGTAFAGLLWFLRWGRIPWDDLDWKSFYAYYRSLQEPIRHGHVPYYITEILRRTDRYRANLEAPLGPDTLLLGLMSVNAFYLIHVLFVFGIGCAGLLALRKEVGLTTFAFAVLVALFVFNGHLTAHLRAGHAVWIDMLLVPWVFVALIREARQEEFRRNGVVLVLVLGALIAGGAWHIFVASALFVACFCLQSRRGLWFGTRVFVMLAVLVAFRLLPGIVTFGVGDNTFLSGFPSARLMFEALALGRASTALATQTLDWWEYDTYLGFPGVLIACVGLWPFREPRFKPLDRLYLPSLALLALSYGNLYRDTLFRLPGLVSERISTRLLIVPALIFVLRGCVHLDQWVVRHLHERRLASLAVLGGAWLLMSQLVVEALMNRLPEGTAPPELPLSAPLWTTPVEPGYVVAVWVGSFVSLVGLGGLWFVWTRKEGVLEFNHELWARWEDGLRRVVRRFCRPVLELTSVVGLVYVACFHTALPWALAAPLSLDLSPRPADAVVVFAGGYGDEPLEGGAYPASVDAAVGLYRDGFAGHIVFQSAARPDAERMRDAATSQGVPEAAIALVVQGENIYEHVLVSRDTLRAQNWRRILLVSSRYNMRRAVGVWRTQAPEVEVVPSPVPQGEFYDRGRGTNLGQIKVLVHEYAALVSYWWRGWI